MASRTIVARAHQVALVAGSPANTVLAGTVEVRSGGNRDLAALDGASRRRTGRLSFSRCRPLVRQALERYREGLHRDLPDRLERLVLFGSHARGEAHDDSDVDVLVVLSRATYAERARAIDIGGELGLELLLPMAPVVLTREEWAELVRRERRLVTEIERDGVEA